MVRNGTEALSLGLADGKSVQVGVEQEEMRVALANFHGKKVVIVGNAVYRPSGKILRVDIQHIEEDSGESPLFSRIPAPFTRRPVIRKSQDGLAGFFGIWPGDETDEELLAMVEELRGR